MEKQFKLDNKGASEWLAYIYEGGQAPIDAECEEIKQDFVKWLSYRFQLREDQLPFLLGLGELVHESYSAAVRNALQLHGEISLEKEELTETRERVENPKVVFKEEQNGTRPKSTTATRAKEPELAELPAAEAKKLFYAKFKHVATRIPSKDIASYLSIMPSYFSKL